MMKHRPHISRTTIILSLCICLTACSVKPEEPGVSRTLAEKRAAVIDSVRYDLYFNIPEDLDKPVRGTVSLDFSMSKAQSLVLDWCGETIDTTVTVNGSKVKALVHNEHIVIPGRNMRKGRNNVKVSFVSADRALNRHEDYLYTLFVPANARTVFPCFDQPDIKATFSLRLEVPDAWKVLSNGAIVDTLSSASRKVYNFCPTKPLPTYLFSFVAGEFNEQVVENPRSLPIRILHRRDPQSVERELKYVGEIASAALSNMESITGIPYPFEKYDMVILPGYQFGGMEHPGAIQFNDKTIFVGERASIPESMKRRELICHETAHMWFGDLVTMKWFDDVWVKEVFAGYFSSDIRDYDGDFNMLHHHTRLAYETDCTPGSHPISQSLDNLNQAGLIYGNIIYHKAPVVLDKIVDILGWDSFQSAIRKFLQKYSYSNATWDQLIEILDEESPKANVRDFNRVWVKGKSLPEIRVEWEDGWLKAFQEDPLDDGRVWKQDISVGLLSYADTMYIHPLGHWVCYGEVSGPLGAKPYGIHLDSTVSKIPCPHRPDIIIPNYNGSAYGQILLDEASREWLLHTNREIPDDAAAESVAISLYWDFRRGNIEAADLISYYCRQLCSHTHTINEVTIFADMSDYLADAVMRQSLEDQAKSDFTILRASKVAIAKDARKLLLKNLSRSAVNPEVIAEMYTMWKGMSFPDFATRDYNAAAMHLAIMLPDKREEILAEQRSRLTTEDQRREFDYVSQACNPDKEIRDSLFLSLLEPSGRNSEPWALDMLRMLRHKSRHQESLDYVRIGLDNLEYIQKTSNIFFPRNWTSALIGTSVDAQTLAIVQDWLDAHPDLSPLLRNKILEEL